MALKLSMSPSFVVSAPLCLPRSLGSSVSSGEASKVMPPLEHRGDDKRYPCVEIARGAHRKSLPMRRAARQTDASIVGQRQ
eukprot:4374961-Pleurochrysis_carterae.AAC.3